MDFVIVGLVIGASLVGAGSLLRDLGPRSRPRISRADATEIEAKSLSVAWTRFCQSLGMAVTAMGFLIVVATVIGFYVDLGSGVGWMLVGITTFLAVAGTIASSTRISSHYRAGGFDPRIRSQQPESRSDTAALPVEATTVIVADQVVPLGDCDPFEASQETPVPVAEELSAVPADEPTHDHGAVSEPVEPEVEHQEAVVRAPEPEIAATLEVKSPDVPVSPGHEPDPELEQSVDQLADSWQGQDRAREEPLIAATPQAPPLLGFDPPLIDPDDDLPTWNGPPVERTPPRVQPTPPSAISGAFESSLLSDLPPGATMDGELAGPFQSKLLNELTSSHDEAESSGNDVLIAESPAAIERGRDASPDGHDNRNT